MDGVSYSILDTETTLELKQANLISQICSICLINFKSDPVDVIKIKPSEVVLLNCCKQIYHKKCLNEMICRHKFNCPLCRKKIPQNDICSIRKIKENNSNITHIDNILYKPLFKLFI
jgi:hypothetical protein